MGIVKLKYFRDFSSKTEYVDDSHHGSPDWVPYQTLGTKDRQLREICFENFALDERMVRYDSHLDINEKIGLGSDENCQYKFEINGGPMSESKDGKKRVDYTVVVKIVKSGGRSAIKKTCDLEKFLISEGFKIKNRKSFKS